MTTSINFRTATETVSANIVNTAMPYQRMRSLAENTFNSYDVKINKIGKSTQVEEDGTYQYDIYEAYVDSGSVDYIYFAINTNIEA